MSRELPSGVEVARASAKPSNLVPVLMLVAAAASYGLMPTLNKVAVTDGVPPIAYAFWFSAGSTIILYICCFIAGTLPRYGWEHVRTYVVTGALGISFPAALLAAAAPHLPAGVVALVLALVPSLTYLMALMIRMERFRWISIFGLLFGLGGVCALALPEGGLPGRGATGWLLLTLISAVSFAFVGVFSGRFRPADAPSVTLACGMLLAGTIAILPVVLVTRQHIFFEGTAIDDIAIFGAAAVMALFIYLFFETIRRAGPVFFAQFNYLNVLTGIVWAAILLNERLTAWAWVALFLMFVGLICVNAGTRRAAAESRAAGAAR